MASSTKLHKFEGHDGASGLLLKIFLREQKKSPGPILLTLLSITIGVAAIVGVDITSHSALSEFERANKLNSGLATHQIVGDVRGLDENIYTKIKLDGRFPNAAPIVQTEVTVNSGERSWQLLGIDPLSDYRIRESGLLGDGYMQQIEKAWPIHVPDTKMWPIGSTLRIQYGNRQVDFIVAGEILNERDQPDTDADGFLVTDIMWAQAFLKRLGLLTRIDLRLNSETDARQLQSILPNSVRLIDLQTRHTAQRDMTRAFRTNLTALGYLTLLVSMFLIYNSTVFQIARRRGMLSQLRAIGYTHHEITRILGTELSIIALTGVSIGVCLGYLLSSLMLALVTDTINILYFDLAQSSVRLPIETILKSVGMGFLGTAIAGVVPIREAGRIAVKSLSIRSFEEDKALTLSRKIIPIGICCFVMGALLIIFSEQSLAIAFAGLFLLVLGPAACTPWLIHQICQVLAPLVGNTLGLVAKLAIVNIRSHLSRTGISVIALSLAVSASLGVTLMIDSFRYSVDNWIHHYMRSDLYVVSTMPDEPYFSDLFRSQMEVLEGVESAGYSTRISIQTKFGLHNLLAMDISASSFRGFMIQTPSEVDLWKQFNQSRTVLVTEAFANRHAISVGDQISLPTTQGDIPFEVIGIYLDYSSEHGLLATSWANFNRYFPNSGPTTVSVVLEPGIIPSDIKQRIKNIEDAPEQLLIRSNRELREQILYIFDQTFEITELLRWLTLLVAITGMIFSLVALQLERSSLNAKFKAVGFSRAQLTLQIIFETSITGFLAGLIAIPLGLMLCMCLIDVINVRSFGWTMMTRIDPVFIFATAGISTLSASAAGIYPAMRMWRTPITTGLRDE